MAIGRHNVRFCCKHPAQAGGTEDPLRSKGACLQQARVGPLPLYIHTVPSRLPGMSMPLDEWLAGHPSRMIESGMLKTAENSFGSPSALRRMIAGHERAAVVAREAERLLKPEEAFEAALDLWSLCPEKFREGVDAVRAREIEETRAAWSKLKRRRAR